MGSLNYMGNEHAMRTDCPVKRGREADSTIRQQKRHVPLDKNFHQDESGQPCSFVNPNPVSTGLRLSYEEDEHNSSVTSVSESMNGGLPVMASLDNIKVEIDRQKEELDRYIRLQVNNLIPRIKILSVSTVLALVNRGLRDNYGLMIFEECGFIFCLYFQFLNSATECVFVVCKCFGLLVSADVYLSNSDNT